MLRRKYGRKTELPFKKRIIYTILLLILFRLCCYIPLPFVDNDYIKSLLNTNGTLTLMNLLTGGSFEKMSIMALGITPYITASIVLQLFGVVFPRLADMQKEGSSGQAKMERITLLTGAGMALVESVSMMIGYGRQGLLTTYTWYSVLIPSMMITIGCFALSSMGQFMTKHLFGNGTSLILLVGILSSYFSDAQSLYEVLTYNQKLAFKIFYCGIAVVAIILLFMFTLFLNGSEKRIKVTYSGKVSSTQTMKKDTVIPLKLIAGSVVPIIFASTLISMPAMIQTFTGTDIKWLWIFNTGYWFSKAVPWASIGIVIYCVMIVFFSYYYNMLNMNEIEIADRLKRSGGTIYGIRPGKPTSDYLRSQMKYLTFLGGIGLCIIALIPQVITNMLHIPRLAFLGTSIIITVSVISETTKAYKAGHMAGVYAAKTGFLGGGNSLKKRRKKHVWKKEKKQGK